MNCFEIKIEPQPLCPEDASIDILRILREQCPYKIGDEITVQFHSYGGCWNRSKKDWDREVKVEFVPQKGIVHLVNPIYKEDKIWYWRILISERMTW